MIVLVILFLYASGRCGGFTPKEHYLLSCGTSSDSSSQDGRSWSLDENATFSPLTSFSSTVAAPAKHDTSAPHGSPYSAARIFNSSFTYSFPVSPGPKFLRLYFFPTVYSEYDASQFYVTVKANDHVLLRNFSARLAVDYIPLTLQRSTTTDRYVIKEYYVPVPSGETSLKLTFSPTPPTSYAFVNGIEVISVPDTLYDNPNMGSHSNPIPISPAAALETAYRLNVGGGNEMGVNTDGAISNMYRLWLDDNPYLFLTAGHEGLTNLPIEYTEQVPNYTAPEHVYQTERHLGYSSVLNAKLNLTWRFKVDPGFYYMVRLHWCELDSHVNTTADRIFEVYINNVTVEDEMDVMVRTNEQRHVPVFVDYIVYVTGGDGGGGSVELWIALHPSTRFARLTSYNEVLLNGLEIFKMNKSDGSLDAPNPHISFDEGPSRQQAEPRKRSHLLLALIGGIVVGGVLLISLLACLIFRCFKVKKESSNTHGTSTSKSSWFFPSVQSGSKTTTSERGSTLPSHLCRRFSLAEIRLATQDFNEGLVIGHGGFGNVYKGMVDGEKGLLAVAIKRLNASSKQGVREFVTEIEMLSKLRHVHLVSLIGFCDESGEMILVYEYMEHGTLHDHLYNTGNPPLSWNQRLNACLGAAKGLHYLHCGASQMIIHRDVKSTNILLDEKWVSKVSDFGLSKLGPMGGDLSHVSTAVKGSIGYLDLEYYKSQRLTEKSDVYSFGVVLFEVLCGRAAVDPNLPKEQVNLAKWARGHQRSATLNVIVDPNIKDEVAPACLRKFGEVADSCVRDHGSDRPSMADVVWSLEFVLELQEKANHTFSNCNTNVPSSTIVAEDATNTSTNNNDDFSSNSAEGMTRTSSSSALITESFENYGESISGNVFSEINLTPKGR